ncbi:MAG: hypothetical protein WC319_12130 [Candidatus Paceibacterota bacterium]|jgi:hypothetical protein
MKIKKMVIIAMIGLFFIPKLITNPFHIDRPERFQIVRIAKN